MTLINKNILLMDKITKFFSITENKNILINILNNKYNISLRIIDWFVTNYCKKYNIFWINNEDRFVVYLNYKLQLKAYSKKYFDPFCRRERIEFKCKHESINTTVGQLNFFKWILNNKIMDYIEMNIDDIENDMNESLKSIKKGYKKIDNIRKPRQELSKSALRGLNKIPMKVSITFD